MEAQVCDCHTLRGGSRPTLRSTHSSQGHTLLEVIVGMALLVALLLGLAGGISTSQIAQSDSSERFAAITAASDALNQVSSFGRDPAGFDLLVATYDGSGFDVAYGADERGSASAGAGRLVPASGAAFPPSRSSMPAAVQLQAGYVELTPVPGRTDLVDVTVTVGWKGAAGAGSDAKVVLCLRLRKVPA